MKKNNFQQGKDNKQYSPHTFNFCARGNKATGTSSTGCNQGQFSKKCNTSYIIGLLPDRYNHYFLLCFILLSTLLQSCNATRFLDKSKNEKFLVKNSVVIDKSSTGKIRKRANLTYELAKLYKQKPNKKFFGIPRQYFYYTAQDTAGRSGFAKFFRNFGGNTFGEEPVLFDSLTTVETALYMQSYLQNRGYFLATTDHEVKVNKKGTKASVIYHVQPHRPFTIDTIIFKSRDTTIQRLMQDIAIESFLKKGNPVDVKLYDQEVARITRYLRNNGYAYFYPQYISNLEGYDSSNVERTVSLKLEVLTPPGKEKHQSYAVGNVYLYPEYDPATASLTKPDTLVDGLFFATGGRPFRVKANTLASSVFFHTGETFSQEDLDNSIRQLGALGVFRPPTVRFEEDTLHPGYLNFYILLTPNKKWEIGADFDINTTERRGPLTNRNLLGLSVSPSLRNRNFLKGAELLIGSVDMGIELALFNKNTSIVNALDFRLQTELYFPRFVDYFGLWKGIHKLGITGNRFEKTLQQRAKSRFSAGYNLLKLLNNYDLQFANLSFGFEVPVSVNHQVYINHFGVDLVIPKIIPNSRFDSLLNEVPSLQNSFSRQFITGLLFRDANFIYTSSTGRNGSTWYFRGYFDLSGLEVMGANALYNQIAGKSNAFSVSGVEFSHYAKLEFDGRYFLRFDPLRSIVFRLNSGITAPYYKSGEVPYVKQFFVGGPYSVRGWYARELGPGLYKDPLTDDPQNRTLFYQSGNFKLEFNIEYRFHLMRPFGLFDLFGALFLDGGNVWTLEKDPSRVGSQLAWKRVLNEQGEIVQDNFLKAMGLSSGFGTRWDFTYFILRLDFGTPIRQNFPDKNRNQRYAVDFSKWQFSDIRYQLALGYPF